MADLIDRQQAIDAMCDACSDWCDEGVCKKVSAIQRLPSAQPERKRGQWILVSDGYTDCVKCDKCGEVLDVEKNFCPNCGADMRGESE